MLDTPMGFCFPVVEISASQQALRFLQRSLRRCCYLQFFPPTIGASATVGPAFLSVLHTSVVHAASRGVSAELHLAYLE
jgi:hypothetical protein